MITFGDRPGFKGGGANWAVALGPPQLRGLHKKTVKNYYIRRHKVLFETDDLELKK